MAGYIDSHSHWADPRLDSPGDRLRQEYLAQARARGIEFHLQGGVGPQDWQRQIELHQIYPQVWPVFGLHPYWVAEHTEDECDQAMDLLAVMLPRALALGEAGLDFRPHVANGSEERQICFFESQLQLAQASNKVAILHVVQAHAEAIRILQMWGYPQRGAIVHSFNGSVDEAQAYLQLGLHLSLGGPVAREKNERLRQAVKVIPMERLLIETDCPDQPGDRYRGHLNPPVSLVDVAQSVATIRGVSFEEILDISSRNLRKLLAL